MSRPPNEPSTGDEKFAPAWVRVVWFVGLWGASILTLGAVALVIKMIIR
jgi:Protein of unknown function (DUF2474)